MLQIVGLSGERLLGLSGEEARAILESSKPATWPYDFVIEILYKKKRQEVTIFQDPPFGVSIYSPLYSR